MIAGLVVEAAQGRAETVRARLSALPSMRVVGAEGDRLAVVFSGAADLLEQVADRLVREDEDVLGVFSTFAAEE